MRDEIDMRLLEEHGPALNRAIWYWIGEVSAALAKLNEHNYAAPWREEPRRTDCRFSA
jgi:hypothetical protein